MEDNLHKTCTACGEGTFEETQLYDDWRGELHCTVCGLKVKRRIEAQPTNDDTDTVK